MISLKLKTSLSLLLLGFVLGCIVAILLVSGCNRSVQREHSLALTNLKKEAESLKASYEAKLTSLENTNRELQTRLQQVQTKLNEAKVKTTQSKAVINKMVQPRGFPAKDLLRSPASTSSMPIEDSCESLKAEVRDFISDTEIVESLYEEHITVQEQIIAGKDSVVLIQQDHIRAVTEKLGQSLQLQTELVSFNNHLQMKFKRQKSRGKVLAVASAILSGVATHYLLK